MSGAPLLCVRDLNVKRGGAFTLQVEALGVDRGDVLALLGPNGAGKSTLLQALALLEPAARGEIVLDGRPVTPKSLDARRRMAVVLQEPLLLHGSVRDNVSLGLRLHHLPRAEREQRIARWMERTGIVHLAGRKARSLSGGEQRRVSLARALALEPLVLFLDEPFAALDAPSRRALLAELPGWLRDAGCATVLVTHDRDEALHLADRVAVLIDGAVRQCGPIEEVFTRPADEEVAAFLGVENILRGDVLDTDGDTSRIRVGDTEIIAAGAHRPGPVLVAIHPELILLLSEDEPVRTSARNRLRCRVVRLEPAGSYLRVHLDAGFPLIAAVTRASAADLALEPGSPITAALKATAVHLIDRP
jgi:molybdopterin-binding protein